MRTFFVTVNGVSSNHFSIYVPVFLPVKMYIPIILC